MSQPDFLQKLAAIQANPAMIQTYMQSDPRIQAALGVMLGVGGAGMQAGAGAEDGASAPPPAKEPEAPPAEPAKELTEEEKARAEVVAMAEAEKKIAVGHYSAAAKMKKEPEKKKAEVHSARPAHAPPCRPCTLTTHSQSTPAPNRAEPGGLQLQRVNERFCGCRH